MLVVYGQKMMADAPRVPTIERVLGDRKYAAIPIDLLLWAPMASASSSSSVAQDTAGCSTPSGTTSACSSQASASGACCSVNYVLCSLLAAAAGLVIVGSGRSGKRGGVELVDDLDYVPLAQGIRARVGTAAADLLGEIMHDCAVAVPRTEGRLVAVGHAVVFDLCRAGDSALRRIHDDLAHLRCRIDENDAFGSIDARLAYDVPVVRGGAPVGADRRKHRIGPFDDRSDVVVDRNLDGLARIGFPLGKDRFDAPAHTLRRTEKIGQLTNEVDAEIRGNAPPRLFAVEKPRRVLGAAVRENRVRRADAPDRSHPQAVVWRLRSEGSRRTAAP